MAMDIIFALFDSPLFWGFITFLFGGLACSGKFSMNASRVMLIFAGLLLCIAVYRALGNQTSTVQLLGTFASVWISAIGVYFLDQWITPERAFCYFGLYSINSQPVVVGGNFQLSMNGIGIVEKVNYWISLWGVVPNGQANDPYYSLDVQKPLIEIVHAGGRAWDRTLPAGEYRIDFSSKNGNWYEHLKIYLSNGEVKHTVRVTTQLSDGEVLYDSEQQQ